MGARFTKELREAILVNDEYERFLAENGPHPDFNTDFEAAHAYHRKLIALCRDSFARKQAITAERERERFASSRRKVRST